MMKGFIRLSVGYGEGGGGKAASGAPGRSGGRAPRGPFSVRARGALSEDRIETPAEIEIFGKVVAHTKEEPTR
jgi:hypothetical protein